MRRTSSGTGSASWPGVPWRSGSSATSSVCSRSAAPGATSSRARTRRLAVRWRSIVASIFAGVGVNAIIPARSGDAVRVVLAKRAVEGSSYATIASTLVLLSLFDFVVATCFGHLGCGHRSAAEGARPVIRLRLGVPQPRHVPEGGRGRPCRGDRRRALVRGADRRLPPATRTGLRHPSRPARATSARSRSGRRSTGASGFWRVLFFLRAFGAARDRAQRAPRPGLRGARGAPPDQPVGDRDRAGVPALPASRSGVAARRCSRSAWACGSRSSSSTSRSASRRSSSRCGR